MSRIYWDTMLFVYWLEDREPFSSRIAAIYRRITERSDSLYTSAFTLGELLVGPRKRADLEAEQTIVGFFQSGEVTALPFDCAEAMCYTSIRAAAKVAPPDAIHLACASAYGIDLFLTNDKSLSKMIVPNIQFIDGIGTTFLDGGA